MSDTKNDHLDYRRDEKLQSVQSELINAREELSALKDENSEAAARISSATAAHKQARLNFHVGRATNDDVASAKLEEENAVCDFERTEAEIQLASEEVERLTKAFTDAKANAIAQCKGRQRARIDQLAEAELTALEKLSSIIRELWRLNHDLNLIPQEGRIELPLWLFIPSQLTEIDSDSFQIEFKKQIHEWLRRSEMKKAS